MIENAEHHIKEALERIRKCDDLNALRTLAFNGLQAITQIFYDSQAADANNAVVDVHNTARSVVQEMVAVTEGHSCQQFDWWLPLGEEIPY